MKGNIWLLNANLFALLSLRLAFLHKLRTFLIRVEDSGVGVDAKDKTIAHDFRIYINMEIGTLLFGLHP